MFKGKVMTAGRGLCWSCKTSWFHSGEDSWYGLLGYDTLWSDGWVPVLWKGHTSCISVVQNGGIWYPCVRLHNVN